MFKKNHFFSSLISVLCCLCYNDVLKMLHACLFLNSIIQITVHKRCSMLIVLHEKT